MPHDDQVNDLWKITPLFPPTYLTLEHEARKPRRTSRTTCEEPESITQSGSMLVKRSRVSIRTSAMRRVPVALAASLALAGCGSFTTGSLLPDLGGGYPITLQSDPLGAEARTSLGPACRTPCTVAVPARGEFTVTFALAGYDPQTVPVSVLTSGAIGTDYTAPVQFAPNPVVAQLEAAPPPVAAKKKSGKTKPRTVAKTAPAPAAADVPPGQRTIPGAQPTTPP